MLRAGYRVALAGRHAEALDATVAAAVAAGPGMTDPATAGPGMAGPGMTDPATAGPGMAGPGMTDPATADPGMAGPGMAGEPLAVPADVRSATSVAELFAAVVARWGRVDVLVNNAGTSGPGGPLDSMPLEQW